jgi:hypothetical protein
MVGACGTYGRENRLGALRVLVGKPLCIGSLGRSKRRWENNIKMFLQTVEGGVEWIDLAEDRDKWWTVVSAVMQCVSTAGPRPGIGPRHQL